MGETLIVTITGSNYVGGVSKHRRKACRTELGFHSEAVESWNVQELEKMDHSGKLSCAGISSDPQEEAHLLICNSISESPSPLAAPPKHMLSNTGFIIQIKRLAGCSALNLGSSKLIFSLTIPRMKSASKH
jgi:hypothetical protein